MSPDEGLVIAEYKDPRCLHCAIWRAIEEFGPEARDGAAVASALVSVLSDLLSAFAREDVDTVVASLSSATERKARALAEGAAAPRGRLQ